MQGSRLALSEVEGEQGAGGGESRFDDKKLNNLFFGVPL
jgi:hypothetical protein